MDMKKMSDNAWRRRLSVTAFIIGCTVVGASGIASAQYVTPPPAGGSSTDSQTDPGGTNSGNADPGGADSAALEAAGPRPLSLTGPDDRAARTATQAGAGGAGQGSAGQSLPITGGDVVALTGLGLAAVALGAVLLGARRHLARG
jgi:hypothetical protein